MSAHAETQLAICKSRPQGTAVSSAMRPTLATSRRMFAAAVICILAGFAASLYFREAPTRLVLFSGIVAVGALAASLGLVDLPNSEAIAKRDELLSQGAVFVLFFAFYAVTAGVDVTPYNAHVRQAFALVHGHTYIDAPKHIEHATFKGYSYQLHPLLPSFLLMPFAAIWGMDTNQTFFSILCGAVDVTLAWRMLGHFRLTVNARTWLTIFFGAGTIVWYETVNGSSWAVSMVVAIMMTLLALDETFGKARPAVVGFFAGFAGLARYDLPFVWPVYLALLYLRGRRRLRELAWFIPGCALTAAIYVAFNWLRYHSIFDQGIHYYMPEQKKLFGLVFFPGDLYTLLFMAPIVNGTFPYIHPIFAGQSIILTSPAFLLALRPTFRRLETAAVAIAALIAMTPALFYWGNGASQYGTRHFLHVFPFLLVLMALGLHRKADQLTRILIGASVFMIAFGVWHVRMWGFG